MFSQCTSPQQVKDTFKKLAFQFHPDKTGKDTNDKMAQIIEAYQQALKNLHGYTSTGNDNKEHTYFYKQDIEKSLAELIEKLAMANLDDITIEIVGTWVWVYGNTKPHSKFFKALKMNWHSKRKMWYSKPENAHKTRYNRKASFMDIRNMYGSQVVQNNPGHVLA